MPSLRMSIRLPFGCYFIMITTSGTSVQPPVNPKVFGWSHSQGKSVQIRKDLCRIWSPNSYFKPWPSFSGHIKEKNSSGFSVVCRASNPLCFPTKHSVRSPLLPHIIAPSTFHTEQCWLGAPVVPRLQVSPRNTASSKAWLCLSPKFIHVFLLLLFCHSVFQYQIPKGKKKHFPAGSVVSVTNTASEMKQGLHKPRSLCSARPAPLPLLSVLLCVGRAPLYSGEGSKHSLSCRQAAGFPACLIIETAWSAQVLSYQIHLRLSVRVSQSWNLCPSKSHHLFHLRLCPPNHRSLQ